MEETRAVENKHQGIDPVALDDEPDERTGLAHARTDLAEDRTLLASERTFAGWVRTALGTVGIGLGFQALFGAFDPDWAPKAIATLFLATGIFIIVAAERRACAVRSRLKPHAVSALEAVNVRLITIAIGTGTLALIAGLWTID